MRVQLWHDKIKIVNIETPKSKRKWEVRHSINNLHSTSFGNIKILWPRQSPVDRHNIVVDFDVVSSTNPTWSKGRGNYKDITLFTDVIVMITSRRVGDS